MSVAEAAHRPAHAGRAVKLSLAFLILIAAGIGLAWYGAGSLRPELTASGLQFRTVKAGTGEPIGRADAARRSPQECLRRPIACCYENPVLSDI